jgi:hypothetical protein
MTIASHWVGLTLPGVTGDAPIPGGDRVAARPSGYLSTVSAQSVNLSMTSCAIA